MSSFLRSVIFFHRCSNITSLWFVILTTKSCLIRVIPTVIHPVTDEVSVEQTLSVVTLELTFCKKSYYTRCNKYITCMYNQRIFQLLYVVCSFGNIFKIMVLYNSFNLKKNHWIQVLRVHIMYFVYDNSFPDRLILFFHKKCIEENTKLTRIWKTQTIFHYWIQWFNKKSN